MHAIVFGVKPAIPVIIVAGYLGSGKTTLLNYLLRNNGGTRIGVVVNDFGSINIDSMLVAGQVDSMVSLGNGCLCCAVDVSDMDELFDRLAHPRSQIDVIVVEASGLAEPKNLIRLVLGSLNPYISFGGLVEMIDAAEFADTRARHPEIDQHLRLADLVLVNKADRLDASELSALVDSVVGLVGEVPVLTTTDGRVDPELLFDPPERDLRVARQLTLDQVMLDDHADHVAGHRHLHDGYDSIAFMSATPLDPRKLVDFLEAPPTGLYRMKGFVRFGVAGEARKFVLHTVGRHIRFHPTRWAKDEDRRTQLVLIGAGLARGAVTDRLEGTVHTGDPLERDAMLGVHRYVV